MRKLFIFVTIFLLFCSTMTSHAETSTEVPGFGTDFDAFQTGDPDHKVATFKFLGEEKTYSVWEFKNFLRTVGYGHFFANDDPNAGYTANVHRAFKAYVSPYEKKIKAALEELATSVRKE